MHIPLDRAVRDWVLVPLTLTIAAMMVARQYAMVLMAAPSKQKADLKEARERTALARAALLRGAGGWLPPAAVARRIDYFCAKPGGLLWQKPATRSAHEAMMTNPDAVTGMLKQSLGGIVPQVAMGAFVSFFFSGFILGKVPFPLSPSFRLMLQRGVDLPSLDVTYFTALSYYILLLFGLRGAFTLVFREDTVDEAAVQRQMMGGGGGAPGAGPPDMAKAFEAERAALGLAAVVPRTAVAEAAAREAMAGVLAQPPVVRR